MILTFIIALAFLRVIDFFAHRGWLEAKLSRKIIHIGTGPIFVLCWMLFPGVEISRYLAALVPLTITGQRTNAVLIGEEDWQAIQETLFLASVPGLSESIRQARNEGIDAGSTELDW